MSNEEKRHVSRFDHMAIDRELSSLTDAQLKRLAESEPAASEAHLTETEFKARRAANMLIGRARNAHLEAERNAQNEQRATVDQQKHNAERAAFEASIRTRLPGASEQELKQVADRLWIERLADMVRGTPALDVF